MSAAVSLGLDEQTDVSSDDDAIVAAGRARLALALDLARDIGDDYLGGVIYSCLGRYARRATARGRANSIASIAWLADKAAASGITLGLEFCNRYRRAIWRSGATSGQTRWRLQPAPAPSFASTTAPEGVAAAAQASACVNVVIPR